jgi:hypothetical protein
MQIDRADLLNSIAISTRRRAMRSLVAAGIGLGAINAALDAEAKKKRKKKKCKKPQPITLQTAIISCPGPSTTTFSSSRRFAQTFSATQTGAVTTASVELAAVPGGSDFLIEIRAVDGNGVPTAEVLASAAVVDAPQVNASPMTLTVAFNPPASVAQSQPYAVVITGTAFSDGYEIRTRIGNACAGQMFVDPLAIGTFTPETLTDLVFSISLTSTG